MKTLVSGQRFRKAADKDQALDALAVRKGFATKAPGINESDRTIKFTISTAGQDRDGDTIAPSGWQLSDYIKNPVVLFGHDHSIPPIGKALSIALEGDKLVALAQFADRETHALADTVFRLFAGGFMSATSVGFIPRKWSIPSERDYGIDFVEQDLIEFSAVGVPSNPEALVQARSKGVNVAPLGDWAGRLMDEKSAADRAGIDRKTLENVYRITVRDGKGATTYSVPDLSANVGARNAARVDLEKAMPDAACPSFGVSARTPGVVYVATKTPAGGTNWIAHKTTADNPINGIVEIAATVPDSTAADCLILDKSGVPIPKDSALSDVTDWEIVDQTGDPVDNDAAPAAKTADDKPDAPDQAKAPGDDTDDEDGEIFTTGTSEGHAHEYAQNATVTDAAGDPEHVHAITYDGDGVPTIEPADDHDHTAAPGDAAPNVEEDGAGMDQTDDKAAPNGATVAATPDPAPVVPPAIKERLLGIMRDEAGRTIKIVDDSPDLPRSLTNAEAAEILSQADSNGFAAKVAEAIIAKRGGVGKE